jgi:CBS domain-containing protein
MENILVADVMTREPVTAKPDDDLLKCAKKIVKKKVGSLLLVNKKKLVGFIDERDILWALVKKSKKDLSNIKAMDISPKKIITVRPLATVQEAINKMKKAKFERLPVINNNQLVGIITAKDILNFHPEFYPELEEFAKIREEVKKLKRIKKAKERSSVEGVCEECGETDFLYRVHGMLVCESCKDSI